MRLEWGLIVVLLLALLWLRQRRAEQQKMRRLWYDQVMRTHLFVVAAMHDLPSKSALSDHLLKHQDEMAAALAGKNTKLQESIGPQLRSHVLRTSGVVDAASVLHKTPSDEARRRFDETVRHWTENADAIAATLTSEFSIPMHRMMREHLRITAEALQALLNKNYEGCLHKLTEAANQAEHIADGLIK